MSKSRRDEMKQRKLWVEKYLSKKCHAWAILLVRSFKASGNTESWRFKSSSRALRAMGVGSSTHTTSVWDCWGHGLINRSRIKCGYQHCQQVSVILAETGWSVKLVNSKWGQKFHRSVRELIVESIWAK